MPEKIATAFSYLFHPILMPLYALALMLHSGLYGNNVPLPLLKLLYLVVILFSIVLPASFILGMHFLRIINTVTLDERRERFLPLFFGTLSLFFTYYFINRLGSLSLLSTCFFAMVVASILSLLISIFWKISLHMIGIGGLIAFIAYFQLNFQLNLFYVLICCIFLAGILGSARLMLKAHVPSQVYTGFITGFLVVSIVLIMQPT